MVDLFQVAAAASIPQRRVFAFKGIEPGVKWYQGFILPVDGVFFKKFQPPVESRFLATVHQRYAGYSVIQHRECFHTGTQAFVLRTLPGVFIVVGDELHGKRALGIRPRCFFQLFKYGRSGLFAFGNFVHQVVKLPAIIGIERIVEEPERRGVFGQHPHIGFYGPDGLGSVFPVINRHFPGHVAAETIDVYFLDPEQHIINHGLAHVILVEVEVGHVGPVKRRNDLAFVVVIVPGGVLSDPGVVARSVVGHPVYDHLHAHAMCSGDEAFEIFDAAVFRVDAAVILHSVIGSEGSFSVFDADGVNGHKPEDIHAHVAQAGQVLIKGVECAFGRILAHINLVNSSIAQPIRFRGAAVGVHCGRSAK